MANNRNTMSSDAAVQHKKPHQRNKKQHQDSQDQRQKKAVSYEADEPDFPRGGAPALTSQEIQEARAKAEADFNDEGRPRKKQRKGAHPPDEDRAFLGKLPKSVELLRYKNLSVGMKVWGVILEIGRKDIVVSLPGGLRGFVRAEDACDIFPESFGVDADINDTNGSIEGKGKHRVSLKGLFHERELVSCVVIKLDYTELKENKKKSKRIGLSLKLSVLHDGLTIDAIHEGSVVRGYVTSIEDHGYLLSFGVPRISGFLPYTTQSSDDTVLKLKQGQLVQGVVSSLDKKRAMVMLDAGFDLVASMVKKEVEGLTMELLVPGTLVNARVRAVLKNGLLLSFLTYFTGTVNIFHLQDPVPQSSWREGYSENLHLKARILYVDPLTKLIGLTLNTHLVQNKCPAVDALIGEVYDDAIVRRVDPTIGLLVELPSKRASVAGYVHISDASDGHIEKLQEKFKEGRIVKGRVIGMRLMDGLAVVTLKESKVKGNLLGYVDVHPGTTVNGVIISVEPSGAVVKLADGIKGFCSVLHMSELQLVKPSKKFQVGAKMKFKVLVCEPDSKRITLTHKKTMVQSSLKAVTDYEEAVEGLITHGWISGVEEYGCFISFYNSVKGLVHRTELGLEPGVKPDSAFQVGQVVKCRILRADPAARRLSLSFILSPDRLSGLQHAKINVSNVVTVGAIVSGVVVHIAESRIILEVPLSIGLVRASMKFEQLSDTPGHIEQLKSILSPGYKFDRLLVLDCDEQKLVLTAKFSLLSATSLPSDIAHLNPNQVVQGYVASITNSGCFVRFLGGLTGLASVPQVSDGFVHNPSHHFSTGQSVRAQILDVSLAAGRFTVSLKQSKCYSTDVSLMQGYFREEDEIAKLQATRSEGMDLEWAQTLKVGAFVEGEVDDIKDYGVIINLHEHKDVVGFVTHHQLGMQAEVGKRVRARVLDVVKSDGVVDLTLCPELLQTRGALNHTARKASKKRASADLEIQQTTVAVVELIKDEYLVLSLPDHDNTIAFAAAHDYNVHVDPHEKYNLGQRLSVTVGALPDTTGRLLVLLTCFSDPTSTQISSKRPRLSPKYDVDSVIKGEIVSMQPMELNVKFGRSSAGRVHITEVEDECTGKNPLSSFSVGQNITAKVVGRVKPSETGSKAVVFDLTLKHSELEGVECSPGVSRLSTVATLHIGQVVTAYVKEVCDEWVWLVLSPSIKGRLFVLDSSDDPALLQNFTERYEIGQGIKCRIARIDKVKGTVDLTLRDLDSTWGNDLLGQGEGRKDIKKGDIVGGRISKVHPGCGGLSVQIGTHLFGRAYITDLLDVWKDNPSDDFHEGQFVRCFVVDVSKSPTGSRQIDLSLRASVVEAQRNEQTNERSRSLRSPFVYERIEDLSVGLEVEGFVKSISNKGCFITLSRRIDARILLSDLSDTFTEDPAACFPCGKLVKGRIISIELSSGRVDVSLKSLHNKGATHTITMTDLHVGDLVSGAVRRVESYGLFISISNSSLVGLCHISEVSDSYIKNLEEHYAVGDKVEAKVIKIDEEKNKIFLGMKDAPLKSLTSVMKSLDQEDDADLGAVKSPKVEILENMKSLESSRSLEVGSMPQIPGAGSFVPPLEVVFEEDDVPGEVPAEIPYEDDDAALKSSELTKSSKRSRKRLKEEREAAIRAAERKRLEGDEVPETGEDFERLVHASPNSSFIWIKYMALLLSLGDENKARSVAERALQTINFREEGEKLNIWVAYLNLENVYGNPPKEATLQLFQRALQSCDPKKLHMALIGIYERSELHDMVDELLKTMTQKFKTSTKVWLRRITNFLKRDLPDAAHKALDRALLSLPRRKHIKFISQAAISEYKIGSAERARGMFEGILRNYPKRMDLWSVYLDQELAIGDPTVVRALFERATSLELPPKKMKFLFKKYLDFEKTHGNEQRADYVKAKAMQYVETRLG